MALDSTRLDKPDLCFQCGGIFTTLSALTSHTESEHGKYKDCITKYVSIKEGAFEAQLKEELLYSQRKKREKETVEIPAIEQLKNINKETSNTILVLAQNTEIASKNQIEGQGMSPWNKLLESYKLKNREKNELDIKEIAINNFKGLKKIEGHKQEGKHVYESTIEKRKGLKMLKPERENGKKHNHVDKTFEIGQKCKDNKIIENVACKKETKGIKSLSNNQRLIIEFPKFNSKKKYTRINTPIAQKIFNGEEDEGKICMVPPKRMKVIENLVVSKPRHYENKFEGHFRDTLLSTKNQIPSTNANRTHRLIQSTVKQILTNESGISNNHKKVLQELYVKVQPERDFKCKMCVKSFNNVGSLQSHFKVNHEKRLSKRCTLCNIKFDNMSLYESHRKIVHPQNFTASKCDSCDKVFESRPTLTKHQKGVHQGIVSKCIFCEKTFSFRENLRRHMRQVHTDLRPFVCDQCDLRYGDSGNLKRHKRMVHLKNIVQCQICNKQCLEDLLPRHIIEKHSEPLICKECNVVFKSTNGLKSHKNRFHTEVPKAYPCPHCKITFLAATDRSSHKTKAHKDKMNHKFPK